MNAAFLFNSDDPKYGYSYGSPIRETVFANLILQKSKRHMKVSVGDVLIYSKSKNWDDYDDLTKRTYYSHTWSIFVSDRLVKTFRKSTVYALTFENITKPLAEELHNNLVSGEAYLGVMELDYAFGPHLALFRNSMIPLYRIEGEVCRVFYSMGEDDGKDDGEIDATRSLGYTDVDWEDRGAHGTIFDDYDTLNHFARIEAFRQTIAPFLPNGLDDADELIMVLSDLNPQLFNSLGSAVKALSRADTEEEVAQAAISGRRYIEKLADVLFPARAAPHNGRDVGKAQYRNRIWAFIGDNIERDQGKISALGKEIDRIDNEFNAGLHGDQAKKRILKALVDAAVVTFALLALNPLESRKPYFAHQNRIIEFLLKVVEGHDETDD